MRGSCGDAAPRRDQAADMSHLQRSQSLLWRRLRPSPLWLPSPLRMFCATTSRSPARTSCPTLNAAGARLLRTCHLNPSGVCRGVLSKGVPCIRLELEAEDRQATEAASLDRQQGAGDGLVSSPRAGAVPSPGAGAASDEQSVKDLLKLLPN